MTINHRRSNGEKKISGANSKRKKTSTGRRRKTGRKMMISVVLTCVVMCFWFLFMYTTSMHNSVFLHHDVKTKDEELSSDNVKVNQSPKHDVMTNASPRQDSLTQNASPNPDFAPNLRSRKGPTPPGFIVLGMHRSGTSLLSGLLCIGSQYVTGDNLMGGRRDNPKGFFERWDLAAQNEKFLEMQGMSWKADDKLLDFQPLLAKTQTQAREDLFKSGRKTVDFVSDPNNVPYMMKDPRVCITLKIWLAIMDDEQLARPAVLFTFRHPQAVTLSLIKRELQQGKKDYTLQRGLRLWLIYNQRAVENSVGLCRVYANNERIVEDPLHEVRRIADELTTKCGVPGPPKIIEQRDVDLFFKERLQHSNVKTKVHENAEKCLKTEFENSSSRFKVIPMFRSTIKVYCDLLMGHAYDPDYVWPTIPPVPFYPKDERKDTRSPPVPYFPEDNEHNRVFYDVGLSDELERYRLGRRPGDTLGYNRSDRREKPHRRKRPRRERPTSS